MSPAGCSAMWWNEELPEKVKAAAERAGASLTDAAVHLSSDLAPDGTFGTRWLVITRDVLLVITPDGEIERNLPTAKLDSLDACAYVGGGLLRAEHDSKKTPLVRYSAARALAFGLIARGFKQFKDQGKIEVSSDNQPKKCPHCGRPLDLDESICPRCIRKGQILRRLWEYARAFRWRIVGMAAVLVIGVVSAILPAKIQMILVDDVLGAQAKHPEWLLSIVLIMAAMLIVETAMSAFLERQSVYVGMNLVYRVRRDLFSHVIRMGLPFFDKYKAGELMSRIDGDSSNLEHLISDAASFLCQSTLLFIAAFAMMLTINWQLALITLVPLPLVAAGTLLLFPWLMATWHRLRQRQARMSATLNSTISGVRLVKAFGREQSEMQRFDYRSGEFRDTGVELGRTFALVFPIMGLAMQSGGLLVWYFGGARVLGGVMTLGGLFAFTYLLARFYGPFTSMLRIMRWASQSMAAAQRIFDILDTEPNRTEQEARTRSPSIQGRIRFDNVTFGYEPLKPVLKNINLDIAPGEMIGLVGESGVGKSTTTNLILRFYTVNEGALSIDGINICAIHGEDLRSQMAAVPQEPYLFAGSLAENIAYGRQNATPEDMLRSAIAANAHGFIMKKPDAYDSAVGEQGGGISVGEKQRLTIARAIVRDPRILILDEATSSVDTDTEKQIQQALQRLVQGRTTIAIAHRLSTLRNASRLVVLKDGQIQEMGSHDELMQKGGEYKRLVDLQSEMSRITAVGG